jgi:hypothetical protein
MSTEHMKQLDLSDPNLATAWTDISDNESKTSWVMSTVGYKNPDDNSEGAQLTFNQSGTGGFGELRGLLNSPSKAYMCILSVIAHDKRGVVSSDRKRLVLVIWVGHMVKADIRNMVLKYGDMVEKQLWKGITVKIPFYDIEEVNRANIAKVLVNTAGGHQPNAFTFGPNDRETVDNLLKAKVDDDDPLA